MQKNRIQGIGHQIKGTVREGLGKLIGDAKLQHDGSDERHDGEHALGVAERQVVDRCLAEQRAIDAAGVQHQPDFGMIKRQLANDKGTAAFGIDPAHRAIAEHGEQDDAADGEPEDTCEQAADAATLAAWRDRIVFGVVTERLNSDGSTAARLSASWSIIGVASARRLIGHTTSQRSANAV